jgi:hypothetical protein
MVRAMGVLCTGTLLVALVGCSIDDFSLSLSSAPKSREQVFAGPPEVVQMTALDSLQKMNMMVESSPTGDKDTIRLKARAPYGQNFVMVLKRQSSPQGDKTAVHLEWEKQSDEQSEQVLWQFMAAPMGQQGGQGMMPSMGPWQPVPGAQSSQGFGQTGNEMPAQGFQQQPVQQPYPMPGGSGGQWPR